MEDTHSVNQAQELVYEQLAVSSDAEAFISRVRAFLIHMTDQVIVHTENALTMMAGVDGLHIIAGVLCTAVDCLGICMLFQIRRTDWEA